MSDERAATQQTIMFADIVDSTGLYEAVGDATAQATLLKCMDLLDEIAVACNGSVQKRIGDEVLCVFPDAPDAARAAARMHLQVEAGFEKGMFPRAMRLRIGFEHGDVIEQDDELFGSSVHTAARLAALAKAGQVLTSKETLERIEERKRPMNRPFDRVQLKGQQDEREVVELLWSLGSTVLSPNAGTKQKTHGGVAAVELVFADGSVRIETDGSSASLGRDEICEVRVDGAAVSRLHGKVSLTEGFVTFEDMSSNGSAVMPASGPSQDVRRRSVKLTGTGELRLGLMCPDDDAAFVRYTCVAAD